AVTAANISKSTTAMTSPKAAPPHATTSIISAPTTTGSSPAAGSSARPTPKPENENFSHHPDADLRVPTPEIGRRATAASSQRTSGHQHLDNRRARGPDIATRERTR